jgi:hypothetical protein
MGVLLHADRKHRQVQVGDKLCKILHLMGHCHEKIAMITWVRSKPGIRIVYWIFLKIIVATMFIIKSDLWIKLVNKSARLRDSPHLSDAKYAWQAGEFPTIWWYVTDPWFLNRHSRSEYPQKCESVSAMQNKPDILYFGFYHQKPLVLTPKVFSNISSHSLGSWN